MQPDVTDSADDPDAPPPAEGGAELPPLDHSADPAVLVAQSLAADVLASLEADAEGALPPSEVWHGLAEGEGAMPSPKSRPVPAPSIRLTPFAQPLAESHVTDAAASAELARLEALLTEQAAALRAERAETERLRALARDAALRFEALEAAGTEVAAAHAERDHAVARALEAEAARAELAFQLDEVRGHLMTLGAAEGALPGESIHTTCARLAGTVRGLLSARAEAEERRDIGWARALLLEQDVEDLRIELRTRERELAESKEHEELAHSEAHALGAKLAPALDRIVELERALARETEKLEEAVSKRGQAEADRLVASAERARLEEALEAQRADATRAQAELDAQRAELARARAELEVQRAQVGLVQAENAERHAQLEQARAIQRGELERLSEARAAVERLAAERGRALEASNGAMHEVRSLLADLESGLDRLMRAEPRTELTEPGIPVPGED